MKLDIIETIKDVVAVIEAMPLADKIKAINNIRLSISEVSPFNKEPVDCVVWVDANEVEANDYNPNSVAPPEMELLRLSILADGYTQPIVAMKNKNNYEVIDGFHRSRVGRECKDINDRVSGYLPLVIIKKERENKTDRMTSTIRHNRARGKHRVDAMSDIVIELKKRNWKSSKISKELGMDEDEVLRLCQISGLAEVFSNDEFSKAWDVDIFDDSNYDEIFGEEIEGE